MDIKFNAAFQGEIHQAFTCTGTNGRAALLIHGFPGTPAEMRPVADELHAAGWTVCAPLLPGFGIEIDTLQQKTHDDWYRAAQQAYLALREQYDHVMLVGNSMGAALCMQLAAEYPPHALMLFAPFWQVDHLLWHLLPVLKIIFPRFKPFTLFKPDFNDPATRAGIQNFLPGAPLDDPDVRANILNFEVYTGLLDQVRQVGSHGQQAAAQITCPVLIVQGKADTLVRPERTRRLARHFSAPVRYTEVEGTHELTRLPAPGWADTCRAMRQFIDDFRLERNGHG